MDEGKNRKKVILRYGQWHSLDQASGVVTLFLPSVTSSGLEKGFLQIKHHQNEIKPEMCPN